MPKYKFLEEAIEGAVNNFTADLSKNIVSLLGFEKSDSPTIKTDKCICENLTDLDKMLELFIRLNIPCGTEINDYGYSLNVNMIIEFTFNKEKKFLGVMSKY